MPSRKYVHKEIRNPGIVVENTSKNDDDSLDENLTDPQHNLTVAVVSPQRKKRQSVTNERLPVKKRAGAEIFLPNIKRRKSPRSRAKM